MVANTQHRKRDVEATTTTKNALSSSITYFEIPASETRGVERRKEQDEALG